MSTQENNTVRFPSMIHPSWVLAQLTVSGMNSIFVEQTLNPVRK